MDGYQARIEEAFRSVSIHDGPAVFLAGFRELPPPVGHLLAGHWCQSEVCNGGFHQLFSNPTGVLAPEARDGFAAMGLVEWSTLVGEAMTFFGTEYPRDRAARRAVLPTPAPGRPRRVWDPFAPLDDRFYAVIGRTWTFWRDTADAYARRVG